MSGRRPGAGPFNWRPCDLWVWPFTCALSPCARKGFPWICLFTTYLSCSRGGFEEDPINMASGLVSVSLREAVSSVPHGERGWEAVPPRKRHCLSSGVACRKGVL